MQSNTVDSCRPHLTEDIIPFTECRNNLANCFSQVRKTHRPLIVTQNGRASTILINAEDFDPLWDIFVLSRTIHEATDTNCNILGVMRCSRLIGTENLG